jgi:hypothetical protein
VRFRAPFIHLLQKSRLDAGLDKVCIISILDPGLLRQCVRGYMEVTNVPSDIENASYDISYTRTRRQILMTVMMSRGGGVLWAFCEGG